MFAASSQYGRGHGGNYGGDGSTSNGMKNFKTQARSVNIPMTTGMGMQNFGYSEHSSDREASSIGPISSFSNQQGYHGMNGQGASQISSAQRETGFNGQHNGQYQNSSQNPFMDKGSLARINNAGDTKQKVDGKVRSERFMKDLQGILASQLECIKEGIVRDLKSYKEVDESVKRTMGLSVDSLSESIELLKNDIKNVVKNYARKVEETMNEQHTDLQEISKQFSNRVKSLFPNCKNSKKKSAQEIEEELDSVLGSLSGEISALQRELGLIRSQISVDGEFIKEKLETIAAKEHEGFRLAATGQEAVQRQILDLIKSSQNAPPPAQAPAIPKAITKLRDKEWEQELLMKANKQFHTAMLQYSRKTMTLERDIDRLRQKEVQMEQEIKMLKQRASSTASGSATPLKSSFREESLNRLVLNDSASKDSLKKSNLKGSKRTFFGTSTKGKTKKNFADDEDYTREEVDDSPDGAPTTSKPVHWKTLARMKRDEEERQKPSNPPKPSKKRHLAGRLKDKIASDMALQELRSRNSRWDFLRTTDQGSDEESSDEEEEESSQQSRRKMSRETKGGRTMVPESSESKRGSKIKSKNPAQLERESTKKKVSKIAGTEVAEAMQAQSAIIDKATRGVRILRIKAAVS